MANYNPASILLKKDTYKVAAYCRISRDDGDGEANSIAIQKQMISDYVGEREDMVIVDFYTDQNFTGTNFNRPEWLRLLDDIEHEKVNTIIVKDLSRFGRSYIDAGQYLERIFPEKRIRFIAINDGIDNLKQKYDIATPIKNLINEGYARDISQKVQSAFKTKQAHGEFIGAFAGYGFAKDKDNHNKLRIDEEAAEVVRRIFDMYIEGHGKMRIAKILNQEGVLSPAEYKKSKGLNYNNKRRLESTTYWTYSTIHKMLKNEMYLGNMIQNKYYRTMHGKAQLLPESEWIKVKGTHDAIIDEDTWNTVQDLLKTKSTDMNLNKNVNIFAGKLKCGDCGRALSKTSWKKPDGTHRTYFTCGTYKRYGLQNCTAHTIQQKVLEDIILNDLNKIIESIQNLKKLVEESSDTVKTYNNLEIQLSKIQMTIDKIKNDKLTSYQDLKDGILSREDYLNYVSLCEEKLQEKDREKVVVEEKIAAKNEESEAFDNPWISHLLETGKVEKLDRDIVLKMIDKIYVYEDKTIKIIYNFNDELKVLNVQE